MRRLVALTLAALLALPGPASAGLDKADITILKFRDLAGWDEGDQKAGLAVFVETCRILRDPQWRPICKLAETYQGPARGFFELFFRPVLIENGTPALFTGYYEPELNGSLVPTARFHVPVYRRPPELVSGSKWLTREQIQTTGILRGRGLEIAWVDDPVDLQFLQIQGSGRIRLPDGSVIRLGYAGSNGHRYRSLGGELVRRGVFNRHQVSEPVIRSWVRAHPQEGEDLLLHNPSYVFFREIGKVSDHLGPLGAMNRSITAGRSLAVDPAYVPLGAPVWVEKRGTAPFDRLMVAQDTGSRIKGAQRADIFFGTGDDAGRAAGKIHDPGRMVVLLPIQRAYALKPEG